MAGGSPFGNAIQSYQNPFNTSKFSDNITLKQNTVDLGMKVHLGFHVKDPSFHRWGAPSSEATSTTTSKS